MASELVSQDALGVAPYLVLAVDLLLMMTLVRTRSKMKRWIAVALGLIATGVAALVTLGAFSEYSLDPAHVMSHSMFSAVIILCGRLLVTQEVPAILDRLILFESRTFDRFQYTLAHTMMSGFERIRGSIELSIFDRLQYTLAQTVMSGFERIRGSIELSIFDRFQYALAHKMESLASSAKKIHTGNLNLNMIFFLAGFIICLLLLLSLTYL